VKLLLTGASSFTGFWFARSLNAAGHHVVAPLRGGKNDYTQGIRAERVRLLTGFCETVWDCPFGSDAFIAMAGAGGYDVLCHHAARVSDYRSAEFDVTGAVAENARNLPLLLKRMQHLRAVVLTGSVFENDEGAGNAPLRAFSPYGLSKGLTHQVFRYWCDITGVRLGKFVISNPFGPYEEPRFGSYLMRCFFEEKTAEVRTPLYVRDNIHADLLAACYARFVATAIENGAPLTCHPSGYVESQGAFAQRFGREIARRLGRDCPVVLGTQTDFSEPLSRINTEPALVSIKDWDESAAWDSIYAFYREELSPQKVKATA
jgi:UDP-glucose 4-epimerase